MSEATAPATTTTVAGGGVPAPAATTAAPTGQAPAPEGVKAEPGKTLLTQAPTTEATKTEPAKAGEEKAATKEPVTYDLKLPENAQIGKDAVEQIAGLAKELNLSQEQAQKLLDKQNAAAIEHFAGAEKQAQDWLELVKTDKEIGGERFAQTAEQARRATARFCSPALRQMLDQSGLGNHPEVVKAFAQIGKAMSEDSLHALAPGGASAPKEASAVLYGKAN